MKVLTFAGLVCVGIASSATALANTPTAPTKAPAAAVVTPTAPAKAPAPAPPAYTDPENTACKWNGNPYDENGNRYVPKKSCQLYTNTFVFGASQKKEIHFVCKGDTTIIFEADLEAAVTKLSLVQKVNGCSPEQASSGPAKAKCTVTSRSVAGGYYYNVEIKEPGKGSQTLSAGDFWNSKRSQEEKCRSFAASGKCICDVK